MSLHFSTFPVHFFRSPFSGLIHWFRTKTTWETHPTGFLGLKRWILACLKFFSEKSWIFRQKRKFFFYLYFLSRNLLKVIPDIIYSYFYHTIPLKRVKTAKWANLTVFSDFWWLSLQANFRGYRASEMPFSCLHVKIRCLEHVWVPSAHRKKSKTYPLKLRPKNFKFSTMEFLGIFCSDLPSYHHKNPLKWHLAHNETEGAVQDH